MRDEIYLERQRGRSRIYLTAHAEVPAPMTPFAGAPWLRSPRAAGSRSAWYPGEGSDGNLRLSHRRPGLFVVITDARGCTDRDSARVILRRSPNVSAGRTRRICLGDTTTLSAQANGSQPLAYTQTSGNLATQRYRVHPNTTTNYYLADRD